MSLTSIVKKIKDNTVIKAGAYLSAGALALLLAAGCRAGYDAPTQASRDRFKGFERRNVAVARPANDYVRNIRGGLEEKVRERGLKVNIGASEGYKIAEAFSGAGDADAKKVKFDFKKHEETLGDGGLKTLKKIQNEVNGAFCAIPIAQVKVLDTYVRTNRASTDLQKAFGIKNAKDMPESFKAMLSEDRRDALGRLDQVVKEFYSNLHNNGVKNHFELGKLIRKAKVAGDKELEKKLEVLQEQRKANFDVLRGYAIGYSAGLESEGMYGIKAMDEVQHVIRNLSEASTGIDLKRLGQNVYKKLGLDDELNEALKNIKEDELGWRRCPEIDDIVRKHMYGVRKELWTAHGKKEKGRELSDEELIAAEWYLGEKVDQAFSDVKPYSTGERALREVGMYFVPGWDTVAMFDAASYSFAGDLSLDYHEELTEAVEAVLGYWGEMKYGVHNGEHVVGDRGEARARAFGKFLKVASKAAIIAGYAGKGSDGGSSNSSSGGNGGNGGGGLSGGGAGAGNPGVVPK